MNTPRSKGELDVDEWISLSSVGDDGCGDRVGKLIQLDWCMAFFLVMSWFLGWSRKLVAASQNVFVSLQILRVRIAFLYVILFFWWNGWTNL